MKENTGPLRTRLLTGILVIVGSLGIFSVTAHVLTGRLLNTHLRAPADGEALGQVFRLMTFQTWLLAGILGGVLALTAYFLLLPMVRRVEESEASAAEARRTLVHSQRHDALTGLPERHYLEELTEHALAVAERHGRAVAMLRLDLGQFRQANADLGTEICDRILTAIAHRIRSEVRAADYVARVGGDEFAIVVPELKTVEGLGELAERITEDVMEAVATVAEKHPLTCRIGVAAAWPGEGIRATELLRRADEALGEAKADESRSWYYHSSAVQGLSDRRLSATA